jgi:hypothetical protein
LQLTSGQGGEIRQYQARVIQRPDVSFPDGRMEFGTVETSYQQPSNKLEQQPYNNWTEYWSDQSFA